MASYQLSSTNSIGKFLNYTISKGSGAINSITAFASKFTITQKLVAALTLFTSIWLFSPTPRAGKEPFILDRKHSTKGQQAKIKELRVVRFSRWIADSCLKYLEILIAPDGTDTPSKSSIETKSTSQVEQTSKIRLESGSVEETDEKYHVTFSLSPSKGACTHVPIMKNESNTKTKQPKSIRNYMVSKLRAWRRNLQDESGCTRRSYDQAHWSFDNNCERYKGSWISRMWGMLIGRVGPKESYSEITAVDGTEPRKRKRPEGDDCLALYIPLNKGVHRLDESDSRHAFSDKLTNIPLIRGLSVVPVIGNWYTEEKAEGANDVENKAADNQLDHISLIQHDFIAPFKQASDCASDGEQYEILNIESKIVGPKIEE